MGRKRTYHIFAIIICIGILVCGCSKTISNGLSEGTYTVQGEGEEVFRPTITFDLKEKQFVFNYDLLSSYFTTGTIDLSNRRVIATTNDGKYTYIFEITDNDTISFIQNGSAKITTVEGESPIVDGTEFKFVD